MPKTNFLLLVHATLGSNLCQLNLYSQRYSEAKENKFGPFHSAACSQTTLRLSIAASERHEELPANKMVETFLLASDCSRNGPYPARHGFTNREWGDHSSLHHYQPPIISSHPCHICAFHCKAVGTMQLLTNLGKAASSHKSTASQLCRALVFPRAWGNRPCVQINQNL